MSLDTELINDFAHAPQAEVWNKLVAGAASNVVFLTRQYQAAWWACFCNSCSLNLLIFSEGGHQLGCAPFYLSTISAQDAADEQSRAADWQRIRRRYLAKQGEGEAPAERTAAAQAEQIEVSPPEPAPREGERVVRLLGGVDVTDYLDIIAAPEQLEAAWAAALDHWAGRADEWDVIDLHSLPSWSGSAAVVARLAQQRGWQVWTDVEETCPVAELSGSWDDYLASLSKKDRHELRRKLRRAEEAGTAPEYKLLRSPDELQAGLEQFLKLHRMSNAAKAEFMTTRMEQFFRDVIGSTSGTCWPEIALLTAEGRAVAAYLSFNFPNAISTTSAAATPLFTG